VNFAGFAPYSRKASSLAYVDFGGFVSN